ncbi:MAG: uroporphyrinogen decarboxylase family protein [Treponemataceae bacterium]
MQAPADKEFWTRFWEENDVCLYGAEAGSRNGLSSVDALPVRPSFTTRKPRVPVLIELGEDWIIDKTGSDYRRYILDPVYQRNARDACAKILMDDIGFHLKPKIDTSSLLHGSVYGNPIEYPEGSTPWLGHIVHGPEDIRKLIFRMERTNLAEVGLVPEFVARYRALGRPYRWRILHDPTSVHGPGTILGFLCGINEFALLLYDEPELMSELIALVVRVTVDYSRTVRKLTGAPQTGVGVFDDVAGLVSPDQFQKYFFSAYRTIYEELAPGSEDDRFLHNDAAVRHLLPQLRELRVNGINPDPETPAGEIRKALPDAVIYGCVPPFLLKDGTPEEVFQAAVASIEDAGADGGLVLTTAGSINMGTPYANLEALCRAADTRGRYDR